MSHVLGVPFYTVALLFAVTLLLTIGFWLALRWLLGRLLPDDTEWVEEAQQGMTEGE